ncbi:MAG: F0F1 ATP synthase subunit B [Candidatus Harrisonbacteria bacterium]|nr:F0F1 ATP synthase subunit B [Candidatus Harrisonbacteria bacterium]
MGEILGKIGFDWKLALVNFVNIFIIFLLLKYFAFKPIRAIIEKRKKLVDESLEYAEKAKAYAQASEGKREELLVQAREEAEEIIERASQEVSALMSQSQRKAQQEREAILAKAQEEIAQKTKEMTEEVKKAAAELVSEGVKKILEGEVDETMNERIIKKVKTLHG